MTKQKNKNEWLTAEELVKQSGESYDTINHWTRIGLLQPKRRGRKRFYEPKNVDRCKQIRTLQAEGHNLVTIRKMLLSNQQFWTEGDMK